jgi:hypothetical protein
MSYYNRIHNILRHLKESEPTPPMMILFKDVGDDYYRFNDNISSKNDAFKDLSDDELKELKFKDDDEVIEYIKQRAYILGIPITKIMHYKPLLISIKDNTHLERYLYDANRE